MYIYDMEMIRKQNVMTKNTPSLLGLNIIYI